MAEVGVRDAASDFGAVHVVAGVVVFGDDRAVDRLGEARPAAAGLEFVGRAEERFAADYVHIQARREEVVVFVAEGAFGRAVLRDFIGLRVQVFFQFGRVGFVVFAGVDAGSPLASVCAGAVVVGFSSGMSALRMSMWQ